MNKLYSAFLTFLLAIGLLAGCGQTEETPSDTSGSEQSAQTENEETATDTAEQEQAADTETEETVAVVITEAGKETIAEKEVAIEEGDVLLDVMKENFDVEVTDQGFITSIEGVSQNEDEGKYWMFQVNGEMAEVGAGELEVEPGDKVTFDLQAVE